MNDRANAEWHRRTTLKSGETQDWLCMDIYTFAKEEISKKDTTSRLCVRDAGRIHSRRCHPRRCHHL